MPPTPFLPRPGSAADKLAAHLLAADLPPVVLAQEALQEAARYAAMNDPATLTALAQGWALLAVYDKLAELADAEQPVAP